MAEIYTESGAKTIPLYERKTQQSNSERVIKRAFDLTIATVALIVLSPLLAVLAVLIKLSSPGPVIFKQTRTGYCGNTFKIFKFRSMMVTEDGDHIVQAQKQDPRVTRIGAFLRRTSLDELPQLFNVVRGEMSLVGPRPHALAHDEYYGRIIERYGVRYLVLPGITGWAQVHGLRGGTPTPDLMRRRVEMDLWYVRNASLRLDLQILRRTIGVVLCQRNAY